MTMARYPLTLFYDGSCRLCRGEIENLLARDAGGRLAAVDCASPGFDAGATPFTRRALMDVIHARDADGQWLRGVDVFVAAYRATGLDWISRVLAHPLVRPFADRAYPWIVRNRYRLSALGVHRLLDRAAHAARRSQANAALARAGGCGDACALPPRRST